MTTIIDGNNIGAFIEGFAKNLSLKDAQEAVTTYWAYGGTDIECDTFEEAFDHAEEDQAEMCEAHGELHRVEQIEFTEFVFDDDAEDGKKTVSTKVVTVEYHHEGSLLEQHGTIGV